VATANVGADLPVELAGSPVFSKSYVSIYQSVLKLFEFINSYNSKI